MSLQKTTVEIAYRAIRDAVPGACVSARFQSSGRTVVGIRGQNAAQEDHTLYGDAAGITGTLMMLLSEFGAIPPADGEKFIVREGPGGEMTYRIISHEDDQTGTLRSLDYAEEHAP